jgi:protein-L-isoaspartate(D-aspartate) O-methyltransferase
VEIDPDTLAFGRQNLERAGYRDVVLVEGDGGLGYPERSPYDRIAVTAACPRVPPPLVEQLATGGRLVAPLLEHGLQSLVLVEKIASGLRRRVLGDVRYVALRGVYGAAPARPGAKT